MRQASIKDVARLAQVSHTTVSRALRGSPLLPAATCERIRRIAAEAGYLPSAAARSLVTRRSATVGVVVTSIADPFAAEVVLGIEDAANEREYSVILANSMAEPEREMRVVRSFGERRVDGVIVTSSRVGALYAETLARTRTPIVLLNNQHPSEFLHSVMIDNARASEMATAHLLELGHRRVAYIGDRFGFQSDTEREGGYRAALRRAGVRGRRAYVAHGDGKAAGGAAAMDELLALSEPPTAVFCYNDMTALGAMQAIAARGLRVPRDVSVVGFDDLFVAQYAAPPLTTVRQPMREMGRLAMQTLLAILDGGRPEPNRKVDGTLVVRASTAKVRKE